MRRGTLVTAMLCALVAVACNRAEPVQAISIVTDAGEPQSVVEEPVSSAQTPDEPSSDETSTVEVIEREVVVVETQTELIMPATVDEITPLPDSTNVAQDAVIVVQFSEAMLPETITSDSFVVTSEFGTPITGDVSYDAATKQAHFTPTMLYPEGERMDVWLSGSIRGASSGLNEDLSWSMSIVRSAFVSIAASMKTNFAVTAQGSVWAWGYNDLGQLGDGTTENRGVPVKIPHLTGVTQVAATVSYTVAVDAHGQVWSWGSSTRGQLGQGEQNMLVTPTRVDAAQGVQAIASGASVLALRNDGTVLAWGAHVGRDDMASSNVPVVVLDEAGSAPLQHVVAIDTAWQSNHVLQRHPESGETRLLSWGTNMFYTMGTGSDAALPVEVTMSDGASFTDVTALYAGGLNVFVLRANGEVWGWGRDEQGAMLGLDTNDTPVHMSMLSGIARMSGGNSYSWYAQDVQGAWWAWGRTSSGVLSVDIDAAGQYEKLRVLDFQDVTQVVTASEHALMLTDAGEIRTVGGNTYGQLGIGEVAEALSTPRRVQGIRGAPAESELARKVANRLVVNEQGELWSWGSNRHCKTGTGIDHQEQLLVPRRVDVPGAVDKVASGRSFAMALVDDDPTRLDDNRVFAWGRNHERQVADSVVEGYCDPQEIAIGQVIDICAGYHMGMALQVTGEFENAAGEMQATTQVLAWGGQNWGQLGNSVKSTAGLATPVVVPGLPSDIVQLACARGTNFALSASGVLYAWGLNSSATAGQGHTESFVLDPSPVRNESDDGPMNDVRMVATAQDSGHVLVLRERNGAHEVWGWGRQIYHTLGDRQSWLETLPVPMYDASGEILRDVQQVRVGSFRNAAVDANGQLMMWGKNDYGEILPGAYDAVAYPEHVPLRADETSLGIAYVLPGENVIVIADDGSVWEWGHQLDAPWIKDGVPAESTVLQQPFAQ